jgi:AcrR family transcriptional regulator
MPDAAIAAPAQPSTHPATARARVRLTPEERIPLILDAALAEFSAHGFTATRMDDIAARAGLSKGGLYAHFSSKDAVFDALIHRSLGIPELAVGELIATASDLRSALEALFRQLYTPLASPMAMATARLMFTEGPRLPAGAVHWRESSLVALAEQLGTLLRGCAARGWCRETVLMQEPWLMLSPLVHLAARQVTSQTMTVAELHAAQAAHLTLLCELLAPPASSTTWAAATAQVG